MSFQFSELSKAQSQFFRGNYSLSIDFRKQQLLSLKKAIQTNESLIYEALKLDLQKSELEAFTTEIGFVYSEIEFTLKHLSSWAKPKRVGSPFFLFPSSSKIYNQPLGKVFIIAPWNYPFQLLICPLIAAISAGNTCLLKPSEFAPNVSAICKKIIDDTFEPNYIKLVEGEGHAIVPQAIDEYRPDLVFFTGSTAVGKRIAVQAAQHLIPTVLELGGKSPCIIDASADIAVGTKRILLGKIINAGQTCVAPDYVLIHESKKEKFLENCKKYLNEFYGNSPLNNQDYGRIINKNHFDRLLSLLNDSKILLGGKSDSTSLQIEPTFVELDSLDHPLMKEEIFGPILPIITYQNEDDIFTVISKNPNPLALYLFTKNQNLESKVCNEISFGGGCINNAVLHLANPKLPFGGIGNSGQGAYHGKVGFDAFSHKKSVLKTGNWLDVGLKYPPYPSKKLKWLKKLM